MGEDIGFTGASVESPVSDSARGAVTVADSGDDFMASSGGLRLGRLCGAAVDNRDSETGPLAAGGVTGSRGGVVDTISDTDAAMGSASSLSSGRSGATHPDTNSGVGGSGRNVGVTSHAKTTSHIV